MDFNSFIFWVVFSVPILPCVICFVLGGIIGTLTMAILNAASDYSDPITDFEDINKGGD